jgi:hypothetical protein
MAVVDNDQKSPLEPLGPGQVASDNEAISAALEGDLSWIEQLKKERDERAEDEVLRLGMPTWGPADRPDLAAEFCVVDKVVLENFQAEARKRAKKNQAGAGTEIDIQFLCTAVTAVFLRRPDTGKLIKLEKDNRPILFDSRLSAMLGLDPESDGKNSKTLLLYLVKRNEIALGNLAVTVARWMGNTSREVEDEVLGE